MTTPQQKTLYPSISVIIIPKMGSIQGRVCILGGKIFTNRQPLQEEVGRIFSHQNPHVEDCPQPAILGFGQLRMI